MTKSYLLSAETRENTGDLLCINRKALKALYYTRGFDFEKQYHIVAGTGKFTFNTIKKACDAVDDGDYIKVLVMHCKIFRDDRMFFVDVTNTKFQQFTHEDKAYKYNVDYFYLVSDFEQHRKNYKNDWYVVMQKKSDIQQTRNEDLP